MKVTRKQLFKKLIPFFEEEMGYTYFKDSISVAKGLFAKKIDSNIYISIGINTSDFFCNTFTCDLYMAQSLDFASIYKGMANDAYVRPGELLTENELVMLRGNESKTTDIWWHSDDADSIESFKKAVQLAGSRFENNFELRERISSNEGAKHIHELTVKVKDLVKNGVPNIETQFVPEKEKDGIPLIWFIAAEYVQKGEKHFNKHTVLSLAADAYRQYVLDEVIK